MSYNVCMNDNPYVERQIIVDLADHEYDRLFPEGTRTPTQMKMRARQVIRTGLSNLHRFPGDDEEANVAHGGPFDFSSMHQIFDGKPLTIKRYAPLWRIYLDDGRVVNVVVSEDIASTVFIDTVMPWVLLKQGDPNGASKIMTMIPFEIITLIENLSGDEK